MCAIIIFKMSCFLLIKVLLIRPFGCVEATVASVGARGLQPSFIDRFSLLVIVIQSELVIVFSLNFHANWILEMSEVQEVILV